MENSHDAQSRDAGPRRTTRPFFESSRPTGPALARANVGKSLIGSVKKEDELFRKLVSELLEICLEIRDMTSTEVYEK